MTDRSEDISLHAAAEHIHAGLTYLRSAIAYNEADMPQSAQVASAVANTHFLASAAITGILVATPPAGIVPSPETARLREEEMVEVRRRFQAAQSGDPLQAPFAEPR